MDRNDSSGQKRPHRSVSFHICILALLFSGSVLPAQAAFLNFTGTFLKPTYYHNYSTEQIESMSHIYRSSRAMHEPGLTAFENEVQHNVEVAGMNYGPGKPLVVWADSVHVDFSITKMNVYVSSQFPEGSCQYRVVLAHENTHVAINDRAFVKYQSLMKRALQRDRSIPTKAHPIRVGSMEEGKSVIEKRIEGIIVPIFNRFKEEVLRNNAKIDTPASYRRTQAQCSHW